MTGRPSTPSPSRTWLARGEDPDAARSTRSPPRDYSPSAPRRCSYGVDNAHVSSASPRSLPAPLTAVRDYAIRGRRRTVELSNSFVTTSPLPDPDLGKRLKRPKGQIRRRNRLGRQSQSEHVIPRNSRAGGPNDRRRCAFPQDVRRQPTHKEAPQGRTAVRVRFCLAKAVLMRRIHTELQRWRPARSIEISCFAERPHSHDPTTIRRSRISVVAVTCVTKRA